MNQAEKKRGRLIFVALGLLFIGPVAAAWALYMTGVWRPGAGSNHGELIQPVITLPRAPQPTADGGATEGGFLYGKWTLVHLAGDSCDSECRDAVIKTRQVRLAMGRETGRIDRVLFLQGPARFAAGTDQPDLLVVRPTGSAGTQIVAALSRHGGAGRIFLVDPLGNLILSYPLDGDPADIRDDLKRLLRLSRIG